MTTIDTATNVARRFAQCDCGSTDADYLSNDRQWWTCNGCGEDWVTDTTPVRSTRTDGPITTVTSDYGDFRTTEMTGPGRVRATFFHDGDNGDHAVMDTGTFYHLGHQDKVVDVVAFEDSTWITVENDEGVRVRIALVVTTDVLAAALVKARRL